jgi:hypothetical protein
MLFLLLLVIRPQRVAVYRKISINLAFSQLTYLFHVNAYLNLEPLNLKCFLESVL